MEEIVKNGAVEHPRGIYSGHVDEKGRLKLPADFQQYLKNLGETKVFATSFDESIARLYPISTWKQVEATLRESLENAEEGEALMFTANDLGGDAEMDAQGRLMIPAELRKALKIENAAVRIEHSKGHIKVYSEEIYQERREIARNIRAQALKTFEKRGLQ